MHKHLTQYNKSNIGIARVLRRRMTDAEKKLWSLVRNNRLGIKFRRQVPFGNYVLDYYCASIKLNVELDGDQHYTGRVQRADKERDDKLCESGIEVMRFSSREMLQNPDGVEQAIIDKIQEKQKQTPSSVTSFARDEDSRSDQRSERNSPSPNPAEKRRDTKNVEGRD